MLKKMLGKTFIVILIFSLLSPVYTGEEEMPVISDVEISGNQFVNSTLIKNQLRTQKGKKFSRIDVNNDIKALYQLNYFSKVDVRLVEDPGNFQIIFQVVEKPIVDRIIFRGNAKIKTKILRKQIVCKEDEFLNESILSSDVSKVKEFYEKKGYKQISVDYSIEMSEDKRMADVTFNITEGKKIRIKRINILGANQIKEKKVLKVMKTKRNRWYNSGIYERAKFMEDLDRIRAFYYQSGYVDIKVLGVKETFIKDNSRVIIDVEISEGHPYKVGTIEMEGNKKYSSEELQKRNSLKPGEIFLPDNLQHDHKAIQNVYYKNGYIDARIAPNTVVSSTDNQVMNIKYTIEENEEVFIDKILVTGNDKTKDIVVRRELNLKPGEKFNGVEMEIAKKRLENLAIFKTVDIYPDPTHTRKVRDLLIEVEEDKTGELSFGAGYSSVDHLIGFFEVTQSNFDIFNYPSFTGDGQKLKFRSEFGETKEEFSFDFTEPWFMDKKLLFGSKIFTSSRDYDSSDYSEDRRGIVLRLAKPVFKYSRAEVRYSFENVDIRNVDDDASAYLKSQEGERNVGKVGLSLVRDVRDNYFNATQGSRLSFDTEVAGVGGDIDYYRTVLASDLYYNPIFNNVFIFSLKAGMVEEFGRSDDVPIFDRFFLGGAWSVRGYDYRDIGPHDEMDDPVGGKFMYYGTMEYVIPLMEQFRTAVFYDFGNLYAESDDIDLGIINTSIGLGARILIDQRIPLRFDYAWPLETDEYHDGEGGKFTFDIGHRF